MKRYEAGEVLLRDFIFNDEKRRVARYRGYSLSVR